MHDTFDLRKIEQEVKVSLGINRHLIRGFRFGHSVVPTLEKFVMISCVSLNLYFNFRVTDLSPSFLYSKSVQLIVALNSEPPLPISKLKWILHCKSHSPKKLFVSVDWSARV